MLNIPLEELDDEFLFESLNIFMNPCGVWIVFRRIDGFSVA